MVKPLLFVCAATFVVGCSGEQGEQGETGATGPQGATGSAGADGADGADGAPGPTVFTRTTFTNKQVTGNDTNVELTTMTFTSPSTGKALARARGFCLPGASAGVVVVGIGTNMNNSNANSDWGIAAVTTTTGATFSAEYVFDVTANTGITLIAAGRNSPASNTVTCEGSLTVEVFTQML